MQVTLTRCLSAEHGTFGLVTVENHPIPFVSLEEPWKDNQRHISCIPKGQYDLELLISPKYGKVYRVVNVPNRSGILIHSGNTIADISGCIILGRQIVDDGSIKGVSYSRSAMEVFKRLLSTASRNTLTIDGAVG